MSVKSGNGVEIRGNSIRIVFYYQNKRLRPALKGLKPTAANVKYARHKRNAILYEIERGTFEWKNHFHQPPPPGLFIANTTPNPIDGLCVNEALDELEKHYKLTRAKSTVTGYHNKIAKIRSRFGSYLISEISPTDIETWITKDLRQLSNKTINEIFIPFRAMLYRAKKELVHAQFDYKRIDALLLELESLIIDTEFEADPFTLDEYARIAALDTHRVQELNLLLFGCQSGLSKSELISYGWEDVDLKTGEGACQRALVEGKYKVTKTKRRNRKLEHTEQALAILLDQKQHTFMLPPIEIEVVQRDNRKVDKVFHRPIFRNSTTGSPIASDNSFNSEVLEPLLRKAGVRYRGMNTVRHTFISRMLTLDMPMQWIITQSGHGTTKMIEKHYGKWINQDRPNMAKEASKRLRELQQI